MVFIQRLILITVFSGGIYAHADLNCDRVTNDLNSTIHNLLALTSSQSLQPQPSVALGTAGATRAPAQSEDSEGSVDQDAGTQQGLGAIFNWFDRNATRSRGLCTLGVRKALQASGWWPCGVGMGLSPQTDAGPNLLRHGFKKIHLTNPSQAKPGTILIYKSVCSSSVDRNARYGHIEMRTNRGYASDFFKTVPISTYNKCRKFKEAYVKVGPPGKACNQSMGGGRRRHR